LLDRVPIVGKKPFGGGQHVEVPFKKSN